MPICSYCYLAVGQHDECFSWDAAQGCGISGPDDPRRLERITSYNTGKAARLEREAGDVMAAAEIKAAGLRREAANCLRSAREARAKAAGIQVREG
jgi:hypothetical protein